MNIIIIDDEPNATKMLELEIGKLFSDYRIIGVYNDAKRAIKEISASSCDLMFLDVEMPHYNGFDLLGHFPDRQFDVVFTTAYSEYAIKAIKSRAIDYLLKPIDTEELRIAVEKVRAQRAGNDHQIIQLLENLENHEKDIIRIPTSNGISFVKAEDILYCKAESNYVNIITTDKKHFIAKTLKYMEDLLPSELFIRCHSSYLVNQRHVKEFVRADGGYLVLSNSDKVKVSKVNKEIFSG